MVNLMTFFNLRLAHIAPLGYPKTVAFSVVGAPLPIPRALGPRSEEERSGRSPMTGKSATVRAERMQLHRANRNIRRAERYHIHGLEDCELTVEQLKKRQANRAYRERRHALAEQRRLLAAMDALTQES